MILGVSLNRRQKAYFFLFFLHMCLQTVHCAASIFWFAGRKRKRSSLLAVLGPKQRSDAVSASQLQSPCLPQPQVIPHLSPQCIPNHRPQPIPYHSPNRSPKHAPCCKPHHCPVHNPHNPLTHVPMQITNHNPQHRHPLSPNKNPSQTLSWTCSHCSSLTLPHPLNPACTQASTQALNPPFCHICSHKHPPTCIS